MNANAIAAGKGRVRIQQLPGSVRSPDATMSSSWRRRSSIAFLLSPPFLRGRGRNRILQIERSGFIRDQRRSSSRVSATIDTSRQVSQLPPTLPLSASAFPFAARTTDITQALRLAALSCRRDKTALFILSGITVLAMRSVFLSALESVFVRPVPHSLLASRTRSRLVAFNSMLLVSSQLLRREHYVH